MPSILVTFNTDNEREKFIEELHTIVSTLVHPEGANLRCKEDGWEERKERGEFLETVMKTLRRDPPIRGDDERRAALYISGEQMLTGSVDTLAERFKQECGSHSANVELREDIGDGKFTKVIRSRRAQR